MDQLICASLSHTHYWWYEVRMLKVPAERAVLDLQKFEKFGIFSKLSNFPRSRMWKWTSTVLVHFHIVESGKFGKYAPAVATLAHSPLPITARENKDRSAQSVQDQASLSPAATRVGFSSPPRPQISIAHGIRSVSWSRLALSAPRQRSSRRR